MLKARINFSRVKLDQRRYFREVDRVIRKVLREAMRAFLTTVLNHIKGAKHTTGGDSFPVQTGEAKASLMPLGRVIQMSVPVTPAANRKNRVAVGKAKGRGAFTPLKRRFNYKYTFSTRVVHFEINEENYSPIPTSATPWGAIAAGREAFKEYVDTHLKEQMPRIKDYLVR